MKKIFSSFLLVLFVLSSNAQINYTFSTATGIYNSITSGTSPSLTATTSGGNTDEGFANAISIGFSFDYNGTNYTSLGVCTNGFLYLGSSGLNTNSVTYSNNLISGFSSTQRPIIAPFWDDLDVQSATNIKYKTTGTAPNRVFTIEWANVLWDYSATSACISFQVSLYESSNIIEFIYKQESGTPLDADGNLGASIGLTASGTGINNFIALNNSSSNPTASISVNTTDIITKPATGQIYRFTPIATCNGTPNAGTASASVSTACANASFNLLLSGYTSGNGITYQWYSSNTGANSWSVITGATNISYTTSQTTAKDYKCLVTCTGSSLSSYSSVVTVALTHVGSCTIANDDCSGAITLLQTQYNSSCTSGSINTSLATQSTNTSTFFGSSHDDDTWYKFVATNTKAIFRFTNISAISGAVSNMAFALSTGNDCTTLTELGGATVTINTGEGETLFYGLTIGATYYVRVATSGTTWRAQGNICIMEPAIAAGNTNSCLSISPVTIDATNNNVWVPITVGNKIVAEINAQGNNLGAVNASVYVSSALRQYAGNGRYYLNRNIELTPTTQPSSNVLVRLYLLNSELNALIAQSGSQVSSLNDLFVTKNSDACAVAYSGGGNVIIPISRVTYGANGLYVELSTASFSSFYIHGGNSVLPTTILEFTGKKVGAINLIKWTATNEQNLKGYEIEKSMDGIRFSSIAFVNVGTQTNNAYSYADEKNILGNCFYRLKAIDVDGKYTYSSIVNIKGLKLNGVNITAVYPNPVSDKLYLQINSSVKETMTIRIADVSGRIVLQKDVQVYEGANKIEMNTAILAKGSYLVTAESIEGSNKTNVVKLMKE